MARAFNEPAKLEELLREPATTNPLGLDTEDWWSKAEE